jgi:hypothetical protein
VNPLDWVLVGIAPFLFIFSFFGYWTASYGPYSASTGGWHFSNLSFFSWFAFVIGFGASAAVSVALFAPQIKLPKAAYLLAIMGFGISFVLYLIGSFAAGPDLTGTGVSFGPGFSQILSIIVVAGGAVLALVRAQQTRTALPGPLGNIPTIGR